MALIRINWRSVTKVAPDAVTTGKSADEAAPAATMRAEKPMLVYITSDDPSDSVTRKLEDVVFAQESVGIGCKLFDTIKMTAGDAAQDRLISENGRYTPRLVLITRDYKVQQVLQRKQLSPGKILKAMKATARKEYKNNFDRMVRDYVKLLNERDRLDGRRAKLADDKARLQAKPNASKAKKIAREEKKYEADLQAWEEKERKLTELHPRVVDKAEA